MKAKSGKDRLIVALDVDSQEKAVQVVQELDNVSIFKIGLMSMLNGTLNVVLKELRSRRGEGSGVFFDLKLGWDIGNTIENFVRTCEEYGIKFITIMGPPELTKDSLKKVLQARNGTGEPKMMGVPLVSDSTIEGVSVTDTEFILRRSETMLAAGFDGLIVSGAAIEHCRNRFPDTLIASPAIRPSGTNPHGHVRFATPREAITLGADYLIVGRPII